MLNFSDDPQHNLAMSYAAAFGSTASSVVFLANILSSLSESSVLDISYGQFAKQALKDLEKSREVINNAHVRFRNAGNEEK